VLEHLAASGRCWPHGSFWRTLSHSVARLEGTRGDSLGQSPSASGLSCEVRPHSPAVLDKLNCVCIFVYSSISAIQLNAIAPAALQMCALVKHAEATTETPQYLHGLPCARKKTVLAAERALSYEFLHAIFKSICSTRVLFPATEKHKNSLYGSSSSIW